MMQNTIIERTLLDSIAKELQIADTGKATIREVVTIVNKVESQTGIRYVRMEMGVPSLAPPQVGTEAEIEALRKGVASKYPMLDGHPPLKAQASRFVKAFLDVDVQPAHCIPVCGSMQGTLASFITAGQCNSTKNTVLFIDPGFPVQKQQLTVLGMDFATFDVYNYRGEALEPKLEEMLSAGNICAIIYSNPNNPAWICFNETELAAIGRMADKYDVVVLEDLAYFGMDFRKDLGTPFKAPFQPTVAKYTHNYILLISSSKAFSYAGQRVGLVAISDQLFDREFDALKARYSVAGFGNVLVNRVLYALSSGTSHSAQYALAAMLEAACDDKFNFIDDVKIYGDRAAMMKPMFEKQGFHLVYATDLDQPLANGFYFTVGYKNMTGAELSSKLLYYGISAISLDSTGSLQQGIRACTAFVTPDQYPDLEARLQAFSRDF